MAYDQRDWISLACLGALASVLLFTQLDQPFLWQDEAQTAVIARTVLSEGIPYGSDGKNFFSQEFGIEYAEDYLWRWHTWLSFYGVAASFLLLGETTAAARVPFALFGLATILLAYVAARRLWRSQDAALAAGGLLALSVPFLVLSRQCRWYTMAGFFALLALHAYGRMGERVPDSGGAGGPGRRERRHSFTVFVAATLLFHSHYFYVATLLAALLIHSLWLERDRFPRVFWVSAAVTAVNAPWILWFSQTRYGEAYAEFVTDLEKTLRVAGWLGQDLFLYFLPPLFALLPVALVALRRWRGEPWLEVSRETWSGLALLGLFAFLTIAALGVLAPGAYFRYLTPIAPCAVLCGALLLSSLASWSRIAAVVFFAIWLATTPIRDFVYEITHDFDGPIEGIVRFLEQHARPGDRVAISYGDMPLKFYTDLRVIGGLTGEDLGQAQGAEWIIIRRHASGGRSVKVRRILQRFVVVEDYLKYKLPFADTPFENREDPRRHLFRSAPLGGHVVVVYGRSEAARARDVKRRRKSG